MRTISTLLWLWRLITQLALRKRISRFFLDNWFQVRGLMYVRNGGGIMVGAKATMPVQVVDEDDAHWWSEGVAIFLLFGGISFTWHRRIIPWSPTHTFKP